MILDEYKSAVEVENASRELLIREEDLGAHCRSIKRLGMASERHVALLESERALGEPSGCDQSHNRCTQLECIIAAFQHLKATDLRDRVYALLALTNCRTRRDGDVQEQQGHETLEIDYTRTPSQVFQDVTKYIMNRDGSLDFLFNVSGLLHRYGDSDWLPSWTPDWTMFDRHWTPPRRFGYNSELSPLPGLKTLPRQHSDDDDSIRISGVVLGFVLEERYDKDLIILRYVERPGALHKHARNAAR